MNRNKTYIKLLAEMLLAGSVLFAQTQFQYTGANATGQMVLTGTVNLSQIAQPLQIAQATRIALPEAKPKIPPKFLPPPAPPRGFSITATPVLASLPVTPASSSFGFNGLTHLDQRNANGGNQFSVEPPNPSIAVSSTAILEGVNNAVTVYSRTGTPLLPTLTSNQVFGLGVAIDRSTNLAGVFPTDMRVLYDQGIDRWFIVQRAQCCDLNGNNVNSSQVYVAVSQTSDPTGAYRVYTIDTTQLLRPGCGHGCVADYPQLGADQNAFFISWNDYSLDPNANPSSFPLGASIMAISKTSLAAGAASPTAFKFIVPVTTGFEFTVQPANTPAGGSYLVASGGVEYFVSDIATGDSNLSIWAMANTMSLGTASPSMTLTRISVPALLYQSPSNVVQKTGPLAYGSTLSPPGLEALIDGSDARVLSVAYVAGRLYVTFGTQVSDGNGHLLVGAAYVILSPTYRGGLLAANVLGQGYVTASNNSLLRPAIGVNAQARGAIVFTLVGPDYFPSAAFVPVSGFSAGAAIQVAAPGVLPEDGFTGYPDLGFPSQGVARWGDYSTAVASGDGSVWMITEYIPNSPRTQFANWGTFLIQYAP